MIIARIISLLIGYIFGLFQTGYIYGKSKGIDIRTEGSGNAGKGVPGQNAPFRGRTENDR